MRFEVTNAMPRNWKRGRFENASTHGGIVWLRPAFFLQTTPQQEGTLTHEPHHIGGLRDDIAFDYWPCRRLALHDPWNATWNPDNYRLFVQHRHYGLPIP